MPETPLKLKTGAAPRFLGFVGPTVSVLAVGGTTLAPYDSLALPAPLMDNVAMPVPASVTPFVPLLAAVEHRRSWC